MQDLIKIVRTYRVSAGLAERLRLAEQIVRHVEPDLRFFIFSATSPDAAQDILQEVLKAVITSVKTFDGSTNEQFWKWCYRIARNKLAEHFRKKASDRLQPMPPDELWELIEAAEPKSFPAGELQDLEYALQLLDRAKPGCRDYLWNHYVFGMDYGEIAEALNTSYDGARMKVGRCLDEAKSLVS